MHTLLARGQAAVVAGGVGTHGHDDLESSVKGRLVRGACTALGLRAGPLAGPARQPMFSSSGWLKARQAMTSGPDPQTVLCTTVAPTRAESLRTTTFVNPASAIRAFTSSRP